MKRKLITFYVFVMSSILATAAGIKPLENTDYIISWNFRDEFFGEMGERDPGPAFFKQNTDYQVYWNADIKNNDYLITITKNKKELSYKLSNLIDTNDYFSENAVLEIIFYPEENRLNMLCFFDYCDIKTSIFIVCFDFTLNKVTVGLKITYSGLIRSMISSASERYEDALQRLFVTDKKNEPLSFYLKKDELTNFYTKGIFCTLENSILTMNASDERSLYKDEYKKLEKNFPQLLSVEKVVGTSKNCMISDFSLIAKSELKEGATVYSASNMKEFSNTPWVPSLNYSDEEIVIESSENMNGLYFCNGFYRENRQDLYFKNNRVKEIEIIYPESFGFKHNVVLIDTAQPQYIPLLNCECKEIKIKIKSVYKGTDYNDTCINCIIPVTEQPFNVLKHWGM